jgi:archaellum biogenesis ATPase FlaH
MRLPGFMHCKGQPHLVEFVSGTGKRYSVAEILPQVADENPRLAAVRAWLELQGPAVSGNGGHDLAFGVVCELIRRFGALSDEELIEALGPWNARCQPPWSKSELLHKVTDARRESDRRAERPRVRYDTPAEVLARSTTERLRLGTGFPTLDDVTGGGIPTGRVVVIGGKPGSGKTAWAKVIAEAAMRGGTSRVGVIPRDGGQRDFADRLAATGSITEDDLPQALSDGRILLQSDEQASVLDLVREMIERRQHSPSYVKLEVLIADSIQTIAEDAPGTDVRLRNNAVVRELTQAARREDMIVFATARFNRESYRSRNRGHAPEDIASFLETSDIEYCGDLIIALHGDPDTFIEAKIIKNRLGTGQKKTFNLKYERETCALRELSPAEWASLQPMVQAARGVEAQRGLASTIEAALASGPKNQNALYSAVGGGSRAFRAALDSLVAAGRILRTPGERRSFIYSPAVS